MKNRFGFAGVCCVLAALLGAACASTPPAEEPQAGVAAPSLDEEIRKAEALKKTIEDYELAFALPEEFEAANEELTSGKEAAVTDYDKTKAKELLDSAAGRYQVVFDLGIEKRSDSRQAEIGAAREEADSYKAQKAAAEDYALGSRKLDEAKELLDARQYVEAWVVSSESLDAFIKSARAARLKRDTAQGELTRTASAQDEASARLKYVESEAGGEQ